MYDSIIGLIIGPSPLPKKVPIIVIFGFLQLCVYSLGYELHTKIGLLKLSAYDACALAVT